MWSIPKDNNGLIRIKRNLAWTSPTFPTSLMETSSSLNQEPSTNISLRDQESLNFWERPSRKRLKPNKFWESYQIVELPSPPCSGTRIMLLNSLQLLKKSKEKLLSLINSMEANHLPLGTLLWPISTWLNFLIIFRKLPLNFIPNTHSGKM